MQDFVKEPVQGLVNSMDNNAPDQLMEGMARGAGSLLRHSVGGVANSASLITGACFDVLVVHGGVLCLKQAHKQYILRVGKVAESASTHETSITLDGVSITWYFAQLSAQKKQANGRNRRQCSDNTNLKPTNRP